MANSCLPFELLCHLSHHKPHPMVAVPITDTYWHVTVSWVHNILMLRHNNRCWQQIVSSRFKLYCVYLLSNWHITFFLTKTVGRVCLGHSLCLLKIMSWTIHFMREMSQSQRVCNDSLCGHALYTTGAPAMYLWLWRGGPRARRGRPLRPGAVEDKGWWHLGHRLVHSKLLIETTFL